MDAALAEMARNMQMVIGVLSSAGLLGPAPATQQVAAPTPQLPQQWGSPQVGQSPVFQPGWQSQ
eukprot:12890455-Prorocentrum_lima.AAC.1